MLLTAEADTCCVAVPFTGFRWGLPATFFNQTVVRKRKGPGRQWWVHRLFLFLRWIEIPIVEMMVDALWESEESDKAWTQTLILFSDNAKKNGAMYGWRNYGPLIASKDHRFSTSRQVMHDTHHSICTSLGHSIYSKFFFCHTKFSAPVSTTHQVTNRSKTDGESRGTLVIHSCSIQTTSAISESYLPLAIQ